MGAVSIAFGIGLQNFPEGAAVSVPLRREGAGRLRSFLLGQASGLVEPVAGVLGALLVGSVEAILPYALAFAAAHPRFLSQKQIAEYISQDKRCFRKNA